MRCVKHGLTHTRGEAQRLSDVEQRGAIIVDWSRNDEDSEAEGQADEKVDKRPHVERSAI
jgi:hypothetical protein